MNTVLMYVIMGLVCQFKAPGGGFRNFKSDLFYKYTAISINVVATRPQGNMGFLSLSSPKSSVPCLPYNSKVYGIVFEA